jgi:hypothetical protein
MTTRCHALSAVHPRIPSPPERSIAILHSHVLGIILAHVPYYWQSHHYPCHRPAVWQTDIMQHMTKCPPSASEPRYENGRDICATPAPAYSRRDIAPRSQLRRCNSLGGRACHGTNRQMGHAGLRGRPTQTILISPSAPRSPCSKDRKEGRHDRLNPHEQM